MNFLVVMTKDVEEFAVNESPYEHDTLNPPILDMRFG